MSASNAPPEGVDGPVAVVSAHSRGLRQPKKIAVHGGQTAGSFVLEKTIKGDLLMLVSAVFAQYGAPPENSERDWALAVARVFAEAFVLDENFGIAMDKFKGALTKPTCCALANDAADNDTPSSAVADWEAERGRELGVHISTLEQAMNQLHEEAERRSEPVALAGAGAGGSGGAVVVAKKGVDLITDARIAKLYLRLPTHSVFRLVNDVLAIGCLQVDTKDDSLIPPSVQDFHAFYLRCWSGGQNTDARTAWEKFECTVAPLLLEHLREELRAAAEREGMTTSKQVDNRATPWLRLSMQSFLLKKGKVPREKLLAEILPLVGMPSTEGNSCSISAEHDAQPVRFKVVLSRLVTHWYAEMAAAAAAEARKVAADAAADAAAAAAADAAALVASSGSSASSSATAKPVTCVIAEQAAARRIAGAFVAHLVRRKWWVKREAEE